MSEKLQKVLARAGKGSRREMERFIQADRVSVNGEIAKLGMRVEISDVIKLDGLTVRQVEADMVSRVIVYNKPEGEICTRNDPEGRKTVFARLPKLNAGRWVAVGRLDINTSGLLLFTTDGELANRLMHPSNEVEREYAVRVFGEVDDAMVNKLRKGVTLEDGPAKFEKITYTGGEGLNKWFNVILSEGRNREVRRIWETQEVQVSRLTRVRYGNIQLPRQLPQGGWAELEKDEVDYLRKKVDMKATDTHKEIARTAQVKKLKAQRIRKAIRKNDARVSGGNANSRPRVARTRQGNS